MCSNHSTTPAVSGKSAGPIALTLDAPPVNTVPLKGVLPVPCNVGAVVAKPPILSMTPPNPKVISVVSAPRNALKGSVVDPPPITTELPPTTKLAWFPETVIGAAPGIKVCESTRNSGVAVVRKSDDTAMVWVALDPATIIDEPPACRLYVDPETVIVEPGRRVCEATTNFPAEVVGKSDESATVCVSLGPAAIIKEVPVCKL